MLIFSKLYNIFLSHFILKNGLSWTVVWLGLLKVNFINHIGISLSLSFYKEFSTLHLWGNNPYGIELLRFMREKDYAFLDNNCNLDNRCRSIIWKEWLWWHSEFLAIFLFEHHRIYEKNTFQSDYEASLHKLFFCLRKPQLWTPLSLLSTSQFLFSPSFLTLPYILHSTYFSSHLYSPPPTYSSPCLSRNNLQISSWFFPFFSFITQNNHKSQQPQLFHQHSPKYSKNH